MHFTDIRKICEEQLANNWTSTPIAYDNAPFDPPNNPKSPWIRCALHPIYSENAALGGLAKRDYATFWMQVFIPLNTGSGSAYDYAKELEILFSNKTINGLTFYQAETSYVGDEGNGWFQLNVKAQCWAQSNC